MSLYTEPLLHNRNPSFKHLFMVLKSTQRPVLFLWSFSIRNPLNVENGEIDRSLCLSELYVRLGEYRRRKMIFLVLLISVLLSSRTKTKGLRQQLTYQNNRPSTTTRKRSNEMSTYVKYDIPTIPITRTIKVWDSKPCLSTTDLVNHWRRKVM